MTTFQKHHTPTPSVRRTAHALAVAAALTVGIIPAATQAQDAAKALGGLFQSLLGGGQAAQDRKSVV